MKKIADQFARVLSKQLNVSGKTRLIWKCGGPAGWKVGHQSVDVTGYAGTSEIPTVLVEIERRRDAPVSNVVKVWSWMIRLKEEGRLPKKLALIQAFSGYYLKTDSKKIDSKRDLAELIGRLMERDHEIRYIPIPFGYNPRKKARNCEGACKNQARLLGKEIIKRLR